MYYELYTGGYDSNLADGITGDLRTTGYFDDLTDFQALVASEISANYSIIAKTQLKVSTSGDYNLRFNGLADAGALFIDGNLYTAGNAITLSAGYHNLEVRVSTNGGPNYEVQWKLNSGSTYAAIDDSLLFVDAVITSWHRADAQVSNTGEGTNATGWYDQSLSGNDLLATNSVPGYPTYYETTPAKMVNFNPTVEYSNDILTGDDDHSYGFSLGKQGKTTFIITSESSRLSYQYCSVFGGAADYTYFDVGSYNFKQHIGFAKANYGGSTEYYNKTGYYISAANYVNPALLASGAKNILGYINSYSEISYTGNTSINVRLYEYEDFAIGGGYLNNNADNPFYGRVSEVINYPWVLNDLERRKVETYLAVKYGITLTSTTGADYIASNGDTIWDATLNTAYNHDIFGLGRDDVDSLDQRVSKSVNDTTVLTLSMSTDFDTTNISDTRSRLGTNLRFLMMGSNDGRPTVNDTTELPTSGLYNVRMNREWLVQPTDVGTESVYLKFDSCYSNSSFKYYMLVDDDGDFTTGNIAAVELTSDGVTSAAYQFTGTVYITVVGYQLAPGGIVSENLWLRADKNVTQSTTVSQWDDFSGYTHTFKQGTSTQQPAYTELGLNFNPALTFTDNTFTSLQCSANTADLYGEDLTVFVMMQRASSSTDMDIAYYLSTGTESGYDGNGNNLSGTMEAHWGFADFPASTANKLEFMLQNHNNTSSTDKLTLTAATADFNNEIALMSTLKDGNNVTLYGNALSLATGSNAFASNIPNYAFVGSHARTDAERNRYFDGNILEVISYNSALSSLDKQKVETYLAVKYGITLDQSGAGTDYIATNGDTIWSVADNAATANSGAYNQNIFGLGRDDVEGLYQMVSHSVNKPDIDLVVSTDLEFATSNVIRQAGAGSSYTAIDNDISYIMFSDNGGDTTLNNSIYNGQFYGMDHTWRFTQTNIGSQAVNLSFGTRYASNDSIKYYVVYKPGNDDFATGSYHHEIDDFGYVRNVVVSVDGYFTIVRQKVSAKSPGGVDSERLWLRADKSVESTGGTASQWVDFSKHGYVFSQSTVANQPYYGDSLINFNYALAFDDDGGHANAGRDYLTSHGDINKALYSQKQDVFVVAKTNEVNNDDFSYVFYMSSGDGSYFNGNGTAWFTVDSKLEETWGFKADSLLNYSLQDGNTSDSLKNLSWGEKSGVPVLMTTRDINNNLSLSQNSAPDNTATLAGSHDYSNQFVRVGGHMADNTMLHRFFTGNVGEIIVYPDSILTDNDIQRVESYLAVKYGLTLDQTVETDYLLSDGDPFWDASVATSAIASSSYNHDIFGLLRDDASALYQRISKSVNDDAILTVSKENNFTDPNDTTYRKDSYIADKDYVMFSNNDSTVTVDKTTELPQGTSKRMAREWLVQKASGFVGTVSLKFDGDFTINDDNERYVLFGDVDGDGDFTTGLPRRLGTLDENGIVRYVKLDSTITVLTVAYAKSFSPGGIGTNLWLWMRADMGTSTTTDGEDVDLWDEMGRGNLVEISETTPSNTNRLYTSNISNFNPAIKMVDGDMDLLARDTVLAQDIYVVAQFTANSAYAGVVGVNNLSTSTIIGVRSANSVDSDYNNTLVNGEDWAFGGVFRLNEKVDDFAHNNSLHLVNAQSAAPIRGPLYLGGYQVINANGFDGYISEVIAYSTTQSVADRQKIESYLALKYGISLDQTSELDYVATDGTVMWDASASGDFKYDIFGLGRDETDSLYQRVSKSANATGVLTVSLNDDFTSANLAASRKADTIANLNFMTFSNNGGDTIADETTNLPAENIAYRMERIWRVYETGDFPDSVNLKFDAPDLSARTYLLYKTTGTNGDFTSGTVTYLGNLDANGEIFNVQLNDGEYFSLFVGRGPGGVVDNLSLWVRADEMTEQWTSNNRWFDYHNMDTCIVDGATIEDSISQNFNPGVTFDGVDDYVQVFNGFSDFRSGMSSFAVANQGGESVSAYESLYDFRRGNPTGEPNGGVVSMKVTPYYYLYGFMLNNNEDGDYVGSNNMLNLVRYQNTSYNHLFGFTTPSYASVGEKIHYPLVYADGENGVDVDGDAQILGTDVWERTNNYIGKGKHFDGVQWKTVDDDYFHGQISEVIMYMDKLTDIEQTRVNTYLAVKYGLTLNIDLDGDGSSRETMYGDIIEGDYLASDSTKIWDSNKFSAYYNAIIGIGTDSTDMLIQKVSRSENDTLLTIASSADFVSSNLDANRTVWNDSTFVVVGHNGVDSLFESSFWGKRNRLMNRVWAADVTGSPDSIFVAIPDSVEFERGIPVVIVSDNANIKSRDTAIKLTEANGFYYAKIPVTANTDFYFTFGALDNYKYMRHGKHFDEKGKKREMSF